ncbi:Oligopeptide transport ATP-binding protein OppF [Pandoraea nosoerga]|uniref:Oligopeptide transport ATP-binding protein OppF n=1 Tax=Pandoraea nosoerga TaxID=2508296 RepID=A0A5E4Y3Q7_9BURK|nr:Oligopeptide transport ATP-binding protein OppF [Pandoraea nosoerga]
MNSPLSQSRHGQPGQVGNAGHGKSNSPSATLPTPIVSLRGVSKRFGERRVGPAGRLLERAGLGRAPAVVRAVDNVDLIVKPGEVVGLVGESGCGKSTLGRMLAGLLEPSSGEIQIHGRPAGSLSAEQRRDARLKIQMIFQDPYASLNPRLRIDRIVGEGALVHGLTDRAGFDDYVSAQLQRAGLDPALRHRYPHQFSGGQRQRIGIARALAVAPDLLVCDEAVAALDVSIQAQILNLFMDLREQLRLTYVFISHDLGVVEHLSDRVVIMYLGRIVESAPVEEVFRRANHPYTQALLAEIPRIDVRHKTFSAIRGEIPSPIAPPGGCHFHPRCPHAMPRCRTQAPTLRGVAVNHVSACHLNDA